MAHLMTTRGRGGSGHEIALVGRIFLTSIIGLVLQPIVWWRTVTGVIFGRGYE